MLPLAAVPCVTSLTVVFFSLFLNGGAQEGRRSHRWIFHCQAGDTSCLKTLAKSIQRHAGLKANEILLMSVDATQSLAGHATTLTLICCSLLKFLL